MIAPFGFDVSQFIPRQQDTTTQVMNAGMQQTTASQQLLAHMAEQMLKQKLTREQQDVDQAMLAEQLGQRSEQAAMGEYAANGRKQAELEAAAAKFAAEQAAAQRGIEGGLVGDATKAFAIGDSPTLQAARSRAQIQAPKLQFQMPGAPIGMDPASGMFGEAATFGDPSKGLNISKGGETLYSGDTAEQRRIQQETARAALDPFSRGSEARSFAPSIASGIGMAGLGLSGADAAKLALEHGDKAAQRDASRDNARAISMNKNAAQERGDVQAQRDRWGDLSAMTDRIAKGFETDVKLIETNARIKNTNAIVQQLDSNIPFAQNSGLLQTLKANTSGAISDYETKQMHQQAGVLNQLQMSINKVIAGGEVPKNFRQQVTQGIQLVNDYNQRIVKDVGIRAMDGIYADPGFIAQVDSPVEAAMFALKAYQNVTGEPPSQKDIEEEARRFAPMFYQMKRTLGATPMLRAGGSGGGGGMGVSMHGDIVPGPEAVEVDPAVNDPAQLQELGSLGAPQPVGPKVNQVVGKKPLSPAAHRALQLLNGGPKNGGQ